METKKIFSILLVILLLIMSAGCAGNGEKPQASDKEAAGEPVTPDKKVPDITDLYLLTRHEDFTYSFSLSDYDGNILFEQVNYHREPKLNQIAPLCTKSLCRRAPACPQTGQCIAMWKTARLLTYIPMSWPPKITM